MDDFIVGHFSSYSTTFNHDSSYCILKKGIPLLHAELERYSRIKPGIGDALELLENTYPDIGKIKYSVSTYDDLVRLYHRDAKRFNKFCKVINRNKGKLLYMGHHEAHAANAFFSSNFDKSLIITLDGGGYDHSIEGTIYNWDQNKKIVGWPEGEFGGDSIFKIESNGKIEILDLVQSAQAMWYGSGNKIKRLHIQSRIPGTIGKVNIGAVWNVIGVSVYGLSSSIGPAGSQAGTIMAMATMGDPDKYYHLFKTRNMIDAVEEHNIPYLKKEVQKSEQHSFDVAAALQRATEDIIRKYIKDAIQKRPNCENLCLGGGVALNSVATGKIKEWFPQIKNIYIPPAPYDGGLTIGVAQYIYHHYFNQPRIKWDDCCTPYMGGKYNLDDIESALAKVTDHTSYQICDDNIIIDKLAQQKIIAIYGGRSESGRRALGNRSIIADPRNKEIKNIINGKVKHRQWFRPFAPSVLEEDVPLYFENQEEGITRSPYMSFVLKFKKDIRELVPGVVHCDGSARLQTVTKKSNEWYYTFLKKWKSKSGISILLNTSFNDREPICETPAHAINCFLKTNLDYLYFYDYNIIVNKSSTID